MTRRSIPSSNPIRRIRLEHHKTLEQFAFECGINYQGVYLNECGVYPSILPSIEHRLVKYYECSPSGIKAEYDRYVQEKRYKFGQDHIPYKLPESDLTKSPILSFRELLTKTRVGFAKSICVQPTLLYKAEKGLMDTIPGQIVIALRQILLPVGDIEELQFRQEEFAHVRH